MPFFGNILPILRSYGGRNAELTGLGRSVLKPSTVRMTVLRGFASGLQGQWDASAA